MKGLTGRILDFILVACALSMTVAVVGRGTLFQRPASDGLTGFKGWRDEFQFPRRIGRQDAAYELVIWTDYQCPACRQFEKSLDTVRAQLGDSLAVIYRYDPLPIHPLAFPAAVAAECANEQGQFASMTQALFMTPLTGEKLPIASLIANSHILNPALLRSCIADSNAAAVAAVKADLVHVSSLNLRGTPGLQIGDRVSTGGLPASELLHRLRSARD